MAIDPRRQQKKLMKKRQKDKARKKALAMSPQSFFAAVSAETKIRDARNYPIYDCWINPSWKEHGLAHIILSRQQPDGNIAFGVYLVDTGCLGVKNAFCNADFTPGKYKSQLVAKAREESFEPCPIDLAHHIIYGAIDYAAQLGFRPHKDFALSQYILEPRENVEPVEGVEFGQDGKPFYIAGPHDNVRRIMDQLRS